MQEDLDTLVGWPNTWQMEFNKDCYVDLYVVVHPFGDVVGCHQQLAFA
jgi:hypothetical protein